MTIPHVQTFIDPAAGDAGKLDVRITLNHSPHSFVFHLTDGPEHVVVTGVSVVLTSPEGSSIPPAALRELADRYQQLESHALAAAQGVGKLFGEEIHVRPAYRHRTLTPEFLRRVVARHEEFKAQGMPPTASLARAEGVSTSTVKHWLRTAAAVNGRATTRS